MVDDHKDDNLCRLCGQTETRVVDIFDDEQQQLAIDKKIIKCLQIKVEASDKLPVTICIDCLNLLDKYYVFYEKTNQTQLLLTEILIKKNDDLSDNQSDVQKNNDTIEQADIYTEQQSSNSENDDEYKNVYEELNSSQNKIEKTNEKLNKKKLKHCKIEKIHDKKSESDDDADDNDEVEDEDDDKSYNEKKIPDNYMTGTESDKESIIKSKKNNSIKELIDRYHWLCTDCNDKLASLDLLVEHHKKCHNQQPKYMCVQCCQVYDKYYGFLIHVRRHKNKLKYNCQDCDRSFMHKKVLESHRSSVHRDDEKNKFTCSTCGKIFRQQSALDIHSRCHLPDNIKNSYPCDECGKKFTTKPNLVTHKRIHSGVRNFTCDQCGKSFIQKGNLEAHFLTHSIDKPHSCLKCLKSFKTPLQLKKHETVHTGIKQHICDVCNKSFREKGTLREHTRIHTGAMPFTCEFCGKSFRFKGILTTHRRQHTGERPYSCIECQHHFTNWPNYNKHMKRRHGINTSNAKNYKQQLPQLDVQNNETISLDVQHHEPTPTPTTTAAASNIHLVQNVAAPSQSIVQTISPIDTPLSSSSSSSSSPVIDHDNNSIFRERNSTYYNSPLPTTIQNYVPYNFYMSNISEGELILPNK